MKGGKAESSFALPASHLFWAFAVISLDKLSARVALPLCWFAAPDHCDIQRPLGEPKIMTLSSCLCCSVSAVLSSSCVEVLWSVMECHGSWGPRSIQSMKMSPYYKSFEDEGATWDVPAPALSQQQGASTVES